MVTLLTVALLGTADPAWQALRSQYLGLKTLSGTFEETVCSDAEGTCQDFSGRFFIRLPDSYRLDVTEPVRQTIVADDSVVWFHFPDESRAVRQPAGGSIPLLAFLAPLQDSTVSATLRTDSTGTPVAVLEAREMDALDGLTLQLDPGRKRVTGFTFSDAWGNHYVFRLTAQKWNPKLDAGLFRFAPPRGTAVEYQ